MKLKLIFFLAVLFCSFFILFGKQKLFFKTTSTKAIPVVNNIDKNTATIKKVKSHAVSLKAFAKKNNYSDQNCLLIDMKIPSNKKRFFIFDLKADTIITGGLVAHGSGSETETDSLVFSNIPNTGSTSLGKYKIGIEYNGKFGMAYKLHGLDSTNNKAFERAVVLHAHACIPTDEVYYDICVSLGCPTVSPIFLPVLKSYIKKSKKPLLLWIYY